MPEAAGGAMNTMGRVALVTGAAEQLRMSNFEVGKRAKWGK